MPGEDQRNENQSDEKTSVEPDEMPSKNYLVHEHLQRMPTLISRGLLYLIIAILASSVIYGFWAKVDIVVESRAVARTTSPRMELTSDRSGYIDRVFVSEGDTVAEGDPLFLIRSEKTVNYRSKLTSIREKIPLQKNLFESKIESKRNRMDELKAERETSIRMKKLQIDQNRSSIESLQSDLKYWQERVDSLEKEFRKTKSLYEEKLTSIREFNRIKNQLQKARNKVEQIQSQIKIKKDRNDILEGEIRKIKQRYDRKTQALKSEIRNLQLEKQSKIQSLRSELESTRNLMSINRRDTGNVSVTQLEENVIRASRSGIVTGIRFRNPGRYVSKGQRLCNIVPRDSQLYMEIKVQNKDIGFIEEGMKVKYKFDAFPYRDYGMREGKVSWVAPSAIKAKRGMIYRVEGTLNQAYYTVDNQQYPIKPGMTARAELVTEQKTIAAMLLSKMNV